MGQIGFGLGEGDGKLTGGIDVAEQDIGERLRSADSRVPGLDDALDPVCPWHADGAAGLEDDDGIRICGRNRFNERVLIVRQRKRGCVVTFAHPLVDEDDGNAGALGELHGGCLVFSTRVLDIRLRRLGADELERRGREVDGLAPDGAARPVIDGIAARRIDLRRTAAGEDADVGVAADESDGGGGRT